ncbi:MAG: hypothetical protein A3F17_07395 [Gammaproteobacteria bacterium RIFCSPHIGHO2_12_FULL_41_15]|nr:MAG: hypothetical protein A3F17_07395 [Gammaproteobacteria bacterium RIFCSPHIGHO2_12_FULL_41_15]
MLSQFKPYLQLGSRRVGAGYPTWIIAEIGINHEGDADVCAQLIRESARAGADAIKLQTMDADENYTPDTTSYPLFKKAALSPETVTEMFRLSRSLGVEPLTTCGDLKTLQWIQALHPVAYKISSGLFNHIPFIQQVASLRTPLIMSTGVATWQDIDEMMALLHQVGTTEVGLCQCTPLYPAPEDSLHLGCIRAMQERYALPVGYSDHSLGIEAAVIAVAAGASLIEKHVTLDRSRLGFDHGISAEPDEFARMVMRIRKVHTLLGSSEKILTEPLRQARNTISRCIVARRPISMGEIFSEDNLTVKRSSAQERGAEPKCMPQLLGQRARQSYRENEAIYV